jgi:DNA-binding response OmpR family regulator
VFDIYKITLNSSVVLLAEDDSQIRESFARLLKFYVKDVISAKDGQEAIELYLKYQPDIIITDVKMPRLNGLEFIKEVRKKDNNTPIIVTSAYTDQKLLLESIKLSLVEYIVKPVREDILESALSECAKILKESKKSSIKLDDELFYDSKNRLLIYCKKEILLTKKEVEFIELLLANKDTLVTRQKIESYLDIFHDATPSALKNLVFKLRKKLPVNIIKTHGKLGYSIVIE